MKNMKLQLFEAEDVVSRKHGGKKSGARYGNYSRAIKEHLPWLFEKIDEAKDHTIRVKLSDFADATGFKMQKVVEGKAVDEPGKLNPTSLGWGFKYSLFHAGIMYNMGKVEDGQPVMIMRRKVDSDVLPVSLQDKKAAGAAGTEGGETGAGEIGDEDKQE